MKKGEGMKKKEDNRKEGKREGKRVKKISYKGRN